MKKKRRHDPKKSFDKRDYEFWRKHGYAGRDALTLARAEKWGRDHDLAVAVTPEEERYEDVYGEKPEPGIEFVTVWIVPEPEYSTDEPDLRSSLENLGFVADTRLEIRRAGAEMLAGLMQRESMPRSRRDPFYGKRSAGRTSKVHHAGHLMGKGLSAEHRRMHLIAEDTWGDVFSVSKGGERRVTMKGPLHGKLVHDYRVQLHSSTGPIHWLTVDTRTGEVWEK
jgi:hypothetical protein